MQSGLTEGHSNGGTAMAKGMDKRKRDEKKPKKEKPKPAIATPSTKNSVTISTPKAKG
jgi:hypothetical protein